MTPKFLAAFALTCSATMASTHEYQLGDIVIDHPTVFETPKTARAGAGYVTLTNTGSTVDRLIEIKGDFPRVMLHTTEEKDGIARMRHVEALEIPAGRTVVLEPGGFHVMFMGLNGDPFEVGETVTATLVFEKAGAVEIEFLVISRDDAEPAHGDHSGHANHSDHGKASESNHSGHDH